MQFDLSPELAELQATVRKLAQERVAPRARAIDETEAYPDDLFELFVSAGLTGLCIPDELGGAGAGIFGLTLAVEEVAKYSQAAALMLLLTRLPTGPVLANTQYQSAWRTPDIQHLVPVRSQSSPSGRARVRMPMTSLPAWGSDSPKAARAWPVATGVT